MIHQRKEGNKSVSEFRIVHSSPNRKKRGEYKDKEYNERAHNMYFWKENEDLNEEFESGKMGMRIYRKNPSIASKLKILQSVVTRNNQRVEPSISELS
jgi:hypothetical protein